MQSPPINRWIVVIGGILIQLSLGAIYAWSAFTKKLSEAPFGYDKATTQWVLSLGLVGFAISMLCVAGKWQARSGPRVVAIAGGLLMGAGYFIAGFAPADQTAIWWILIGVGLIGGLGIGLAYVCPIATLVKWFPDKKGMITGLAVAGFGFGALIWVKLTQGFKFGPFDLTPGWEGLFGMGWTIQQVFRLYGVLFAVTVCAGAMVMINPPAGWLPKGWTPPLSTDTSAGGADFLPRQVIRTPQLWGLLVTFFVGSVAGLMVIGVIGLFGQDSLTAAGIEEGQAVIITGTAMGLFYALFNGLGRIVWGTISDFTGRKLAIILMCLSQGAMMIVFYFIGGSEWGLYLGAAVIGFNFGGNFALFPAITADFFGNRNVGVNYPLIFPAYGLGGVVGPVLGGLMGDHKIWMWAFIPAGIACFFGAGLMMLMKPPRPLEVAISEPVASAAA
jgi:OFA family oxalate/formate antiporter-like MFS transporter